MISSRDIERARAVPLAALVARETALANGWNRYSTGRPCRRGHIAERYTKSGACCECSRLRELKPKTTQQICKRRESERRWRQRHPDKVSAMRAATRLKRIANGKDRAYRERTRADGRQKAWNRANLERRLANGKAQAYARKRLAENLSLRIGQNINRSLRRILARKQITSRSNAARLLGCSIEALRRHLEKMFTKEMSWKNYGKTWEIDHILPLSAFDLSVPNQLSLVCHFTNLRPLQIGKNRRKGNRLDTFL